MAKGYWIGHVTVTDAQGYARYRAANAEAFDKYDARFLVRGGAFETAEGEIPGERHVVIEFPSYRAALDCWNSPEYARARAERTEAGIANILIVEGVD
jgi:uncharacterized protein (DUF1330 family)